MKMNVRRTLARLGLAGVALLALACGGMKSSEDPYQASWEKKLASEQWKASLLESAPSDTPPASAHYALPQLDRIRDASVPPEFMATYPKLVSRAYFRLIAEAFEADRDIRAAYQRAYIEAQKDENSDDPAVQQAYQTARQRYEAHRQMLEGLRSWKAFQEYGSDDLEFFLEEQLRACYALYQKGASEERMVGQLMTGLADLYHKEEGGTPKSL